MTKTAVMFPGQGSQTPGMGHELYMNYAGVKEIHAQADRVLNRNLSELMFSGSEDELKKTVNTQPALVTGGTAIWRELQANGVHADFACGHSLGEYTALVASGALRFSDAVTLVEKRGQLMEEAVPDGKGAMAAIMGLDGDRLSEISEEIRQIGEVAEPANYNAEGQIVISGTKAGVEQACERAKERGARRAIPLNVSGPFHSSLMKPASEKMEQVLQPVTVSDMNIPVIANVTAKPYASSAEIKELLTAQIHSPVRWTDTIRYLVDQGVDTFIEAGPGKVLAGLVKKVSRRATVLPVYDEETFQKAVSVLTQTDNQ